MYHGNFSLHALEELEAKAFRKRERDIVADIQATFELRRKEMLVSMAKIEESVQRFETIHCAGIGLRPKVEIPLLAYHHWAAKFKMKDLAAGICHTTGYECWQEGSGFYEWWVKKNERLVYREAKRCLNSSIIMPATRWTTTAEARREGEARRALAAAEHRTPNSGQFLAA
jgi:hypothetical protein